MPADSQKEAQMFVIQRSLLEKILLDDIPFSDPTTESLGISGVPGRIECYPKADGTVSGIALAAEVFRIAGAKVLFEAKDGLPRKAGERVLIAEGPAEVIHASYKTAQNLMEYASGIANRVRAMLEPARAVNPAVQVSITRKHFPGGKMLSLYAAQSAGAIVHRAGLSESILIFDQHRVFCEDFIAQLKALKVREPEKKVAVEVDAVEEGLEYVKAGADIIQLERFAPEAVREFSDRAKAINPALIVNVAGGVNAANAAEYAKAGADVLVTSWVYFGKPFDIKMAISKKD